jgi:hypothetical protein
VDGDSRTFTAQNNRPVADVTNFTFSNDGEHYAYAVAGTLYVDGVEQAGVKNQGFFGFSPEGKHVVQIGSMLTTPNKKELIVDGQPVAPWNVEHVIWTPDGKHVAWVSTRQQQGPTDLDVNTLYVDQKPTQIDFRRADVLERMVGNWEVGADGVLTFVARTGDEIKRYRVSVKG